MVGVVALHLQLAVVEERHGPCKWEQQDANSAIHRKSSEKESHQLTQLAMAPILACDKARPSYVTPARFRNNPSGTWWGTTIVGVVRFFFVFLFYFYSFLILVFFYSPPPLSPKGTRWNLFDESCLRWSVGKNIDWSWTFISFIESACWLLSSWALSTVFTIEKVNNIWELS